MNNPLELKQIVKEKYTQIAVSNSGCCCGCGDSEINFTSMNDEYTNMDGYVAQADLGLGCGIPTDYARLSEGDVVLDLGSGAGNDVFIASKSVGNSGKVVGLDMTDEMIKRANFNKDNLNIKNVEFVLGEIENMPLESNFFDVVISNCVLNLVPDKNKAFSEIYRVLKNGGRFAVSDIVLRGNIPDKIRSAAEMYAGCVSGAINNEAYIDLIMKNGFKKVQIVKEKPINIPDNLLGSYLDDSEIMLFQTSGTPIFSITVYGEK